MTDPAAELEHDLAAEFARLDAWTQTLRQNADPKRLATHLPRLHELGALLDEIAAAVQRGDALRTATRCLSYMQQQARVLGGLTGGMKRGPDKAFDAKLRAVRQIVLDSGFPPQQRHGLAKCVARIMASATWHGRALEGETLLRKVRARLAAIEGEKTQTGVPVFSSRDNAQSSRDDGINDKRIPGTGT